MGLGMLVSKAWAKEVQKQGQIALYSTSWDNYASIALSRKLNLYQYGTDIEVG